ncbi:anti-sigma factor [Rhodococcus sp. BP-149]|jgi:anti-sigma-K factor RskA|uniref:anti-sigma factor n=1 Tax=unclassified Rhodococcus (in: high G+C Gram-positive bacteria) TaxID=192944 RepID=UPI000691ECB0|nr:MULTISPECIES: anti-sigma factor [unclassified Rhodococcus (in: high G+C Gram-positive bacteria)]MBY6679037.1 anti-sigma factor [Rhodococcus sp. BP-332]MBY6683368.1 anti-sigma factor [Rhodococcus sp. BP-316]MBY6685435.1 anti-sigma factor [Rhodococcus sp. BP-288]MBY6696553.1 anti-sigma factor [Rhodococcus sp. BP-188]MBY6696863.1 anti-sigma factor [Rhodococcus sp. BP-285]
MSDHGSPERPVQLPDRDLLELAYLCALDAMAASEQYETMTRLDDTDAHTRRRFDAIVRDVRETMAVTSDATRTPAPADLRVRILGAVEDTAQVDPDGATVLPLRPSRRRGWRIAAMAAAAAVVVGVGGAVAVQQNATPSAPTATVAAPLESPVAGGGTMSVQYTPGDERAVLRMTDVAAPPAGSVYQVWLIEGSPVSVGTMDADDLSQPASVPVDGATALSVTVEPAGGSPFPTSGAVARVALV